jgi:hypothetical protein
MSADRLPSPGGGRTGSSGVAVPRTREAPATRGLPVASLAMGWSGRGGAGPGLHGVRAGVARGYVLGVVTLRAATLFSETAGARRFRTEDACARFGVSPQSM